MNSNLTPSDIELLIHCHCIPTVHPRYHAPAMQDGLRRMTKMGLIRPANNDERIYTTTSMGAAHIEQICQLPLPVQEWYGVNGRIK